MRIGLDLDNTIIDYGDAFLNEAKELKCLPDNSTMSKTQIRDFVKQNYGNTKWVEIQKNVYGNRIKNAKVFPGFKRFLLRSFLNGCELVICSHKTEFPLGSDSDEVNLREEAKNFLIQQKIIGTSSIQVSCENIFFSNSIDEKINSIKINDLDYFIDDLSSILSHIKFPQTTIGVQFLQIEDEEVLLDDPHSSFKKFRWWDDISSFIFGSYRNNEVRSIINSVFDEHLSSIETINNGGNSAVFSADLDQTKVVVKMYRSDDRKNIRCLKDTSISNWLSLNNIQSSPIPLLSDFDLGISIFNFIDGKKLSVVSKCHIDQALSFLQQINKPLNSSLPKTIGKAKEACFFYKDITRDIERRYNYVSSVLKEHDRLLLSKIDVLNSALSSYPQSDLIDGNDNRVFSPSDFGFHNGILGVDDGRLHWIDFEYFGLDSLVKVGCDFVLHPANSLSLSQSSYFLRGLLKIFDRDEESFFHSVKINMPFFALRWCLIILYGLQKFDAQGTINPDNNDENLMRIKDRLMSCWLVIEHLEALDAEL